MQKQFASWASALVLCAAALAQEKAADRVTVPFTDPARPKLVKVSLLNGGIAVKGYSGNEVIVEAQSRAAESERRVRPNPKAEGLRRLDTTGTGLSVEELDNVVKVGAGINRTVDLVIQVPANTSLNLRTLNGGDIVVEHVNGEIDANNLNGRVTLTAISGTVVAHSLNKDVTVTFDRIAPGKTMSFSSLNGDVDVTLPADAKARVKMKSDNGEIFSDFDVKLDANASRTSIEDKQRSKGRYRVQFDRALFGTINGGGPELQFTTFNGKIYLRKKK